MLTKLAILVLRKTKMSVIINCDVTNQKIKANGSLNLYDNTVANAEFTLKDGSRLMFGHKDVSK